MSLPVNPKRFLAVGPSRVGDRLELVLDARAEIGEGAIWEPHARVLYWVDIPRGLVHRYDPTTGSTASVSVGSAVGTVVPRARGGLVVALADGFALLDFETAETQLVAPVETDVPGNRMNDGKCDSRGRLWAGTMAFDLTDGAGGLYRLDADLSVHRMLGGVTCSNGLAWSLDDRSMYYTDSVTRAVDVFDFDAAAGSIAARRTFVTIPPGEGNPDGMTLDRDGGLWVAIWDGWAVRRFLPDGRLDRVIKLPVARVTSCAFGGDDLRDLYITTARVGLGDAEAERQPLAGGLFRVRPGVAGRSANSFGG